MKLRSYDNFSMAQVKSNRLSLLPTTHNLFNVIDVFTFHGGEGRVQGLLGGQLLESWQWPVVEVLLSNIDDVSSYHHCHRDLACSENNKMCSVIQQVLFDILS